MFPVVELYRSIPTTPVAGLCAVVPLGTVIAPVPVTEALSLIDVTEIPVSKEPSPMNLEPSTFPEE